MQRAFPPSCPRAQRMSGSCSSTEKRRARPCRHSSPPSPSIETSRARQTHRACDQFRRRHFMIASQLKELLLQSLVHERGGVLVYQTALECAVHDELRQEWTEYLEQTTNHVVVLTRT